jgi:UDP-N-acetylmuramate dehydrogenase
MTDHGLQLGRDPLRTAGGELTSTTGADLTRYNTFALPSRADRLWVASSLGDLMALRQHVPDMPRVLAGGSNCLLPPSVSGDVLMPMIRGIDVKVSGDIVRVLAGAGECWHDVVMWSAAQSWWGIENLALIPGLVGAAPIQNIGAYGVEVASRIRQVHWLDWESGRLLAIPATACGFGYRESRFKAELRGRGLVVAVELELSRRPAPVLTYGPLAAWAREQDVGQIRAMDVAREVCRIRQSRLPDPSVVPNAGSFFKNPVVDQQTFRNLQQRYPELVAYPASPGEWKLAAGWLIDRLGLRGYRLGPAGVHDKQALVLVNLGGATWEDVLRLASWVRQKVSDAFGVVLEPEVHNWGPWPWS